MNEDSGRPGERPEDGLPDSLPFELRRRLNDAVSDIRPAPDALDRLRAAVPARRRRRRAMVLTTVGTVAVLALATPMVRTAVFTDQTTQNSGSQSDSDAQGENVGDDNDAREGADDAENGHGSLGSGSSGDDDSGSRPSASPRSTHTTATALPTFGLIPTPGPEPTTTAGPSLAPTTATATVGPTGATTPPPAPACTLDDLEQGPGTVLGSPGSDGIAYGLVELRNISRRDCSIGGPGSVIVAAPPGNPPIQVSVLVHQKNDPAVRLPEVAAPAGPLTVRRGATYEFQFAWQPTAGTGVGGSCTPGDDPPGPPPPVPALGYSLADGGVKLAEVRLTAACGGVVYRTDVYLSGAYPKA